MNVLSRKTRSRPQLRRWEVGGEFHWCEWPPGPRVPWPKPGAWYALGRHAVAALLRMKQRRLWIPDYFCHDVVEHWRSSCSLAMYRDDPRWPEPDWRSLRPRAGDWVLAMNYFGARQQDPWRLWKERENVLLLEDHSHDPVSRWALSSDADYAFASLRKTLPVPDGALLWSPRGHKLPAPPGQESLSVAAGLKLSAMLLKSEYLTGRAPARAKAHYRRAQELGEVLMPGGAEAISHISLDLLRRGLPQAWRTRRRVNAKELSRSIQGWSHGKPVDTRWPEGAAPLALVLCLDSQESRDKCREYLENNDIYCPIHWPMPQFVGAEARTLSAQLLSIPIDQRYDKADMETVSKKLKSFRP